VRWHSDGAGETQRLGVNHVDRLAPGEGDNLVENVGKLDFVFVVCRVQTTFSSFSSG
jgi:hypothetical protein